LSTFFDYLFIAPQWGAIISIAGQRPQCGLQLGG